MAGFYVVLEVWQHQRTKPNDTGMGQVQIKEAGVTVDSLTLGTILLVVLTIHSVSFSALLYSCMTSFRLLQFSRLLHSTSTHQQVFVRWKKPPKWRDPADLSWAAPLLEKVQQQQSHGGEEEEKPPAMLHMVCRVRDTWGRPYWEKDTLKSLGLHKVKKYEPVVHKNTPAVNKTLEKVKHLVRIVPITFPHGLPSDESDFHHCVLHADGQLEVKKILHPLEKCLTSEEEDQKKLWAMDDETVEKATRKVLEQFSLSREYFPAKHVYKYNQDGKEHRYTGNHNILGDRDWY